MNPTITQHLNAYLSNLGILYVKLHNLHWNVVGEQFKAVHEYLETLYDGVAESLDQAAELMKMYGAAPLASLRSYLDNGSLQELDSHDVDGKSALETVLKDFTAMKSQLESLRREASEADLYDLVSYTESELSAYNKALWFIRSMLK